MADKKQLGVFWGNKALCFVENYGPIPKKIFSIPYEINVGAGSAINRFVSRGLALNSVIQTFLRDQNIALPTSVNLSLPTKDIIFRSFVIPWMQPNEMKSAVTFEAAKYIPFSLDDLSFSYHPITITEAGTKRLRIIFAAIKKNTLESYTQTLEQANLTVNLIEPSPLSLVRTLLSNTMLPKDETIALIEHGEEIEKIVIVEQQIPQFVREFQVTPTAGAENEGNPNDIFPRLVTEVRISLDYFSRKENAAEVHRGLLLTSSPQAVDFCKRLESDLKIPITTLHPRALLKNDSVEELGFVNAYGINLHDITETPAQFNLTQVQEAPPKFESVFKSINYKPIAITAAICVCVLVGTFILFQKMGDAPREKLAVLQQKLGPSEDITMDKLQEANTKAVRKLDILESIRLENHVSFLLVTLPKLLPEGVWVRDVDITYPELVIPRADTTQEKKDEKNEDKKKKDFAITMSMSGYVYLDNVNEQIQRVNELIAVIKKNSDLSYFFKKVTLETVSSQKLNEFDVTYFQIRCQ